MQVHNEDKIARRFTEEKVSLAIRDVPPSSKIKHRDTSLAGRRLCGPLAHWIYLLKATQISHQPARRASVWSRAHAYGTSPPPAAGQAHLLRASLLDSPQNTSISRRLQAPLSAVCCQSVLFNHFSLWPCLHYRQVVFDTTYP